MLNSTQAVKAPRLSKAAIEKAIKAAAEKSLPMKTPAPSVGNWELKGGWVAIEGCPGLEEYEVRGYLIGSQFAAYPSRAVDVRKKGEEKLTWSGVKGAPMISLAARLAAEKGMQFSIQGGFGF